MECLPEEIKDLYKALEVTHEFNNQLRRLIGREAGKRMDEEIIEMMKDKEE